MSAISVRRLARHDVDLFRELRLEALRTEPDAYAGTVADWAVPDRAEWARRPTNPVVAAFRGDFPPRFH